MGGESGSGKSVRGMRLDDDVCLNRMSSVNREDKTKPLCVYAHAHTHARVCVCVCMCCVCV